MPTDEQILGGRLPLFDPNSLSGAQRAIYDRLNSTMIQWADRSGFESKTSDGKLIGPFNPLLLNPGVSMRFLDLQEAKVKCTTLSDRVRQVVILTVGSVWKADYELYAHSEVARHTGISEQGIRFFAAGGVPDELSDEEKISQRYTLRLSAERHVEPSLYALVEQRFGSNGVLDMTYLAGIYHVVCMILNGFAIPSPAATKKYS